MLRFLSALAFISLSIRAGEVRGFWESRAPLPTARQEVAATVLENRVYVLGGLGADAGTRVDFYDPVQNAWTQIDPLPQGVHHGSAASAGGKVYSIGGFSTVAPLFGTPLANVYEYDPGGGEWVERAPLPSARGSLISVAFDGLIYAIGGRNALSSVSDVTVYDPVENSWTPVAPLPVSRDHLAAALVDGKIYVVGGRLTVGGGLAGNGAELNVFDPATGQWEGLTPMPTARSGHAAGGIPGFLFAIGGEIPGVFANNEVYDIANDRWFTLDPIPVPVHGQGIAVVGDQLYALAGGLIAGLLPSTENQRFNILTRAFTLAQFAVGANITSRPILANPGQHPVTAVLELHRSDGTDLVTTLGGETASSFRVIVEPGGSISLPSQLQEQLEAGGASIYADGPLAASIIFSGPIGFAGVPAGTPARSLFVPVIGEADEGTRAGIAVLDASGLANTVTFRLRDTSGALLGSIDRSLAAFGQLALFLDELFPQLDVTDFEGTLELNGSGELGAVALLQRNDQLATLPVLLLPGPLP